ncbi:MAG: phosphonate C-P lyase system protein PhnH [Pigmentiphaga sp.]|uniref:phosphonate C-P lyase system protein PhnH n=1 Tax=Pigmentiphaga sp. TaxID=1977564 RepID=UPI0029ADB02C|nr:phosphonate C-P lyase system protein PhnH [Pigmentiphaga sp.]MDX3904893.1 phosphonate C-P lyase system protein PhnH [Pigmentiphaga sp.]
MPDSASHSRTSVPSDWQPAAQQAAFRQVLAAFSYPGRIVSFDTGAADALPLLLATLIDGSVSMADPHGLVAADDRRRLGARPATPETAQFVVAEGSRAPDFAPALGSLDNPEQGATLLLAANGLGSGYRLSLEGPGIAAPATLAVQGIEPVWWQERAAWNAGFPLGVDLVVLAGRSAVALPRTTRIVMEGAA